MNKFLKMGISGPSGAGKTSLALSIAQEFGSVLLIDSENKAEYYADKFYFDVNKVEPPFSIKKLLDAVYSTECNVIVIDSLSQFWAGEGGILDTQTSYFLSTGNIQQSWSKVMPEIYATLRMIHSINKHIIATFRTKQDYIIVEDNNDNERILKVGLSPTFKDGIEYEFPIFLELNINGVPNIVKDLTGIFKKTDVVTQAIIDELKNYFSKDTISIASDAPATTEDTTYHIKIHDIIEEAKRYAGDTTMLRLIYKKYVSIINKLPENEKINIIQKFTDLQSNKK